VTIHKAHRPPIDDPANFPPALTPDQIDAGVAIHRVTVAPAASPEEIERNSRKPTERERRDEHLRGIFSHSQFRVIVGLLDRVEALEGRLG